jgi:hypothetical protein
MPKMIYLDSSDFSNLSRPESQISSTNNEILSLLREHKKNRTAAFFMSAVHFSETVHAADEHKEAALRRSELMQELCEGNILRFPTELPKLELKKALTGNATATLSPEELMSERGQWFGFDANLDSLVEARQTLNSEIHKLLTPMPRRERRKLQSELDLRKRRSHKKWREIIGSAPATDQFPANILGSESTIDWFLNEINDQQYREQTLTVMHNPHLMFKYVVDETKNRQQLYDIIRNQGAATLADLERSTESMKAALSAIAFSDVKIDLGQLINDLCLQPSFLRGTISAYADVSSAHIADDDLSNIIMSCPSLHSQIEASKSYLLMRAHSFISRLRAGQTTPKPAQPSDFGDLMHAFYAPYFDIFRCDARFGAVLKRHQPIRTRIADRISDLPRMLSSVSDREANVA